MKNGRYVHNSYKDFKIVGKIFLSKIPFFVSLLVIKASGLCGKVKSGKLGSLFCFLFDYGNVKYQASLYRNFDFALPQIFQSKDI